MQGHTVGGLRTLGEPDFWDPEWPAEVRSYPCEGYVLDVDNSWGMYCKTGLPLPSRLAEELDVMRKRASVWLPVSQDDGDDVARYPELALLTPDEPEQVLGALWRELAPLWALLDTLFRGAIFWYSPYWYRAIVNERLRKFAQSPDEPDEELVVWTACQLKWHEWLMSTRPELGQERPWRPVEWKPAQDYYRRWIVHRTTYKYPDGPDQWPDMGCWQLTAFPQAVAWLKDGIHDVQHDLAALEAEFSPQQLQLQERIATLQRTHFKRVHHKKYLGELPYQRVTSVHHPRLDFVRGRWQDIGSDQDVREQWYDPVEELDQTHADRRLELANELTQLAPFTAAAPPRVNTA
jgi:hypothetical protein